MLEIFISVLLLFLIVHLLHKWGHLSQKLHITFYFNSLICILGLLEIVKYVFPKQAYYASDILKHGNENSVLKINLFAFGIVFTSHLRDCVWEKCAISL